MPTDAELLAADVSARADALDIGRSFIVQAPAGSGKTELLIQRYLKLLTVVDSPEEVLAITFTRKAAFEMRLRVAGALRRARDNEKTDTAHEQRTLDIAKAVLERDASLDWRLTYSPSRMRIETVDAFSAGIARSLPLSSGIGGATATLADASMLAMYRNAAAATLEWLTTDDAAGKAVERLLLHLDNNISLYIAYLARMLASREQWLALIGSGLVDVAKASAARQQLEENIARLIKRQLAGLDASLPDTCRDELLQHLQYAARNLAAAENVQHPVAHLLDEPQLPGIEATDREAWQAVATLLLTKSGTWRKTINRNDGFPAGDDGQKKSFIELVNSLAGDTQLQTGLQNVRMLPAAEYSDEQWQVLLALFNILPLAVAELRRLFSERGATDYAEVALAAHNALGSEDAPGELALSLDYQIRHLLVDEMQDTSIGQYDLLRTLTAGWTPGDGRTAFCVGDPMQSIYRFRDAEVGEFLLARENGIGGLSLDPLILRRNFRSGENLVHWFNTVFSQILPLADDVAAGAISYSESVPVEKHAGVGEYQIHALFGASAAQEATVTKEAIRHCLGLNSGDDMAVLVRSRTQLPLLLHELRRAGISYQAIEIDRLTDLPEVIDVIALTRALTHEHDRLAWLALLRAPWVGLCWEDLHSIVRNDATSSVLQLLSDKDRCGEFSNDIQARITAFITTIASFNSRNVSGSLRDRVESAWLALDGPALLSDAGQLENVYRFFDVIEKTEIAGTLEDVRELEQLLDDERVSSSPRGDCRLQIMTMHKAKGLQFDHVLLYGLGRITRGSDHDVLSWLSIPDDDGDNDMIISPVGPRSLLERDPLHRFIAHIEKDKQQAELDRLLYVACTRAIKSLHLVGHVGISASGEEYKSPDSRSLLYRLWPAIEPAYASAFENYQQASTDGEIDEDIVALVNPVLRRLKADWRRPTIPAAPGRHESVGTREGMIESQVEFYWVGSAARHAGTIAHRWLQRISDGRLSLDVLDWSQMREVNKSWARELGVVEEDVDYVSERVEKAISNTASDDKGRWILTGKGGSEIAVTGVVDGALESVVVDRVRIDDDGTHWIIDYKTSTHEGGDLSGFLQQESDRYRPQLQKYARLYAALTGETARAALYFPLLQEFCEVLPNSPAD